MKLRLLKPRKGLGLNDPWRPIYDMAFGFVVRAKTEGGARLMASKYGGDELLTFEKLMTHLPRICHAQGHETCWNVHTTTSTPQTGDGLTGKRTNANERCQSRWCRAADDLSVDERPDEATVQAPQSPHRSAMSPECVTTATPRTRVETRCIRTRLRWRLLDTRPDSPLDMGPI
jgi:hypothetical protein